MGRLFRIAIFLIFNLYIFFPIFSDDLLLNKANEAFEKLDFLKALSLYTEILNNSNVKKGKERAYIFRRMANCYEQLGKYKKALKEYDNAIKADKFFIDAYYEKALLLYNTFHNKKEAIKVIKQAISVGYKRKESKKALASIYILNGFINEAEKNFKDAVESFTKALYYMPKADTFVLRGIARMKLKQYSLAKIDFKKALSLLMNSREMNDESEDFIDEIKGKIEECDKFIAGNLE